METIGWRAFLGCAHLKKISMQCGLLNAETLGTEAFRGTHKRVQLFITMPRSQRKAMKALLLQRGISNKAVFRWRS